MTNKRIFEFGTIREATKLQVVTIGIGAVKELKEVKGLIWKNQEEKVVVKTKEAPEGCEYDQERTVVIRILGGKVLINGFYDIYAPAQNKVEKLLSNPFSLNTLTEEQLKELKPILEAASELRPSIAPAEEGRKVIVITKEMIEKGVTECYNEWEPDKACKLYAGDIFLVTDEKKLLGYRIGREEFEETHVLN